MILLIFLVLIIYGVLHSAVDLTAVFKNALDLFAAVVEGLQMEAVIVAGVQRVQNGDQSADGIVHRGKELAVLSGIDAALQILTAAHGEVGFHAASQKRLVEELVVTAADVLRRGVGDILLVRFPPHLVAVLLHEVDELLTGGAVLHSFLDGVAQPFLPRRDTEGVGLTLGERETVLPAELMREFFGLLHLTSGLVKLPAILEADRVHDDVIVDVRRVHVGDYHALVAFEVLREPQTNLMGSLEVQRIIRSEGLDDVVVASAIGLTKLFLHCFELRLGSLSHAVDAGDETVHRFLAVGDVVEDVTQTT